jgi:NADPH:quinone reductase-like Zn-dependent oxidoreductase
MKVIVHSRYGPPDVLELKDIDQPVVDHHAVLVRVHAAAVGKGDWLTVQGLPYVARLRYGLPKPKHPVPGFDVAGRIEAVGSNVSQLQPGDEVFGWCDGAFAEYASVPEDQLVLKPANLTLKQAAAVPISGFAALQALRDTGGVPARAKGRHHRGVGRGGQLRGPARQGVRRGGDRGVQHQEPGPSPIDRGRPRHRLHPGGLHSDWAAL